MKDKERKRGKGKENLIFTICLLVVVGVFMVPLYSGAEKKFRLEGEIAQVQEEILTAQKYNQELQNRIKYSDEDEYIEKAARERLNMVKPDEIVFIDKNKE